MRQAALAGQRRAAVLFRSMGRRAGLGNVRADHHLVIRGCDFPTIIILTRPGRGRIDRVILAWTSAVRIRPTRRGPFWYGCQLSYSNCYSRHRPKTGKSGRAR